LKISKFNFRTFFTNDVKIYGKPKQINEKKIAGGTIEQAK